MRQNRSSLAAECRQFSRYLIGRNPSAEMIERYQRACETFATAVLNDGDQRVYRFARRHGWALGVLDAGCGIVDCGNVLRKRLLIASAVLETTTENADVFLPRTQSFIPALVSTAYHGTKALLKIIAGIPLCGLVKIL